MYYFAQNIVYNLYTPVALGSQIQCQYQAIPRNYIHYMIHTILAEHMYLKIYMYNLSCASIMLQQHCFYPNNGFTFMLALYMYTCSNLDFLRHAKRHNLCKGKVKCWPSITNTIGFCFKIFVSDNCDEPTIRFLRKYWRCCTVCHFDSIERN